MLIYQMPLEIIIYITNYLTLSDLYNLMLTCKSFSNILRENAVWRSRGHLIINNREENHLSATSSWYERCRMSHNWSNGFYTQKVIIQHHTNFIPWIRVFKNKDLLLSVGSELRCYPTKKNGMPSIKAPLWKIEVPKILRNDVRTNDISRFIIKGHVIVCGNRDGCAVVYTFGRDLKQKPKFLYHIKDCHENGQVEVSAVEVISGENMTYIVTGSLKSSSLALWCWRQYENLDDNLHNINHDVENIPLSGYRGVRCLATRRTQDKLAIGLNGNSNPILLDVSTRQLLINAHETEDISQATRDIQWHNDNLVAFVTHSGLLRMMDIRTNQVVYNVPDPFLSTLYCLRTDGDRAIVVGSSEHSRAVLFDVRQSPRHVQLYFTQDKRSPVYSLDFDCKRLFAAADRSVACLEFSVKASWVVQRDYSHSFEYLTR